MENRTIADLILFRFSTPEAYNPVDLLFIAFMTLVAGFCVRILSSQEEQDNGIATAPFIIVFISLLGIFVLSGSIDYGLFLAGSLIEASYRGGTDALLIFTISKLRDFLPFFLFSIYFFHYIKRGQIKFSIKLILYIFICFWLMDSLFYEFFHIYYSMINPLIYISTEGNSGKNFLFGTLSYIPLFAFSFLGYGTMMCAPAFTLNSSRPRREMDIIDHLIDNRNQNEKE